MVRVGFFPEFLFRFFIFLKSLNSYFCPKTQKTKRQAPGPGGNDRTRREAFNAPNESSVAALGASLVTKQAGRVPQRD